MNFIVYKSSAGSGKTFTLVKEYLKLALHDEKKLPFYFKKILAVTFTNKAASEMKQRVISALREISEQPENSSLASGLASELKLELSELKRRAAIVLANILHNYSDFSIGTIDSFTHKIVKTFAHDLNLPVNFNLETDVDSFYEKVVAELLSRIGEDDYLTKLLKNYSFSKATENSSWDPEKQILDFVRLLQKENAEHYLNRLKSFSSEELEEFRNQFSDFLKAYREDLRKMAAEGQQLLSDHALGPDDFWHGKNGPATFFKKCLESEVGLEDVNGKRLQEAILNGKWLKDAKHPSAAALLPQLSRIASEICAYVNEHAAYHSLCQILVKQIYPLMLIRKLEELSQQRKDEEQIVFISEFNKKIFGLINNEPTPFIYERLGEKYQHYLLDEFQDTSGLQWQNILPLLDNSLANGWFNLVVGDGKQSIYRWRNADVKQFADLPRVANPGNSPVIAERARTLERNHRGEVLNANYRSVKTVVEFNNALFDALRAELLEPEYQKIYEGQAQQLKNMAEGYVTIRFGRVEREELEETHLNEVLRQISDAVANGFSYGDICIICRYNRQGSYLASELMKRNIKVVSADSLLLAGKAEINTLTAFLQYLKNRKDHVSAVAVLNYLLQREKLSASAFEQSVRRIASGQSLFQTLEANGIAADEHLFELSNILDTCIAAVKMLQLNESAPLYVRFFLDEVNEYLVTRGSDLTQFLEWWEKRKERASVVIPENAEAVKVMTVHSSKGLEFPVVILPFFNWAQYRPSESWVEISEQRAGLPVAVVSLSEKVRQAGLERELLEEQQEQILDNLNLIYVACTRAVERLHIITCAAKSNSKALISDWLESYFTKKYAAAEEGLIRIGLPQRKSDRHRKKEPVFYELGPLAFPLEEDIIRIKSALNSDDAASARRQGIVFHSILSSVSSTDDVPQAVRQASLGGLIREDEEEEMRAKISALLGHEMLRPYFQPGTKSRREAEILTAEGKVLRPDLVIFLENETVLIDYKTGKQHHQKYFSQMAEYENALRDLGAKEVKKLLVYTEEREVIRL